MYLLCHQQQQQTSGMDDAEGTPRSSGMPTKVWAPFFQFQSHEPEFDYLKSTEIEEKINQIKFGPSLGDKLFILSTNGKITVIIIFLNILFYYSFKMIASDR